ncbi:MAG: hypothetical protein WC340_05740 [Kiritimatiellia bacterium]
MYLDKDKIILRKLAWLFLLFVVVCVAAGASRIATSGFNFVVCFDILRVRELLSMFVFAPLICLIFWLFNRTLSQGQNLWFMDLICLLAIYCVACGMGIHDPANRLLSAYRSGGMMSANVRRSILFIDDHLGHWVFWCGFVLGSWCMGLQQLRTPLKNRMRLHWAVIFLSVSLVLLGVILTNLWDEYPKTFADLGVIGAAVAPLLAAHLIFARKVSLLRLPVLCVIYPAYIGSVVGTLLCWQLRHGIFWGS